jgi:2-polyprenyl-3-methyl-5-hydroxy-6-metoxy-1,4-benzoquinol methylase
MRRWVSRLLGTQEHFNSSVVQFVNTLNEAAGPALGALDDVERHREALAARERRMETEMARMRAAHEELRTAMGVVRQANHDLAREMERLRQAPAPPSQPGGGAGSPGASPAGVADGRSVARGATPSALVALSHKYVGFEDQFRGTPEAIRERLVPYADLFTAASNVLDVGCGRGEFLALLAERGIDAQGIDVNESMVEVCRQHGLTASRADALEFLRAQPPGSLGGLLAAQVVEHVDPAYLTDLLDAAWAALKPGAAIVLETINPACWFAFFESYIRDITHVRPLHPDTLKYLLLASGFQDVEVRFRSPYPEHDKLQKLPGAGLDDSADVFNANVEKVNRLLFTYLDYAAIARRA